LLLLHGPGVTSFKDMSTLDGIIYKSYQETVRAMDLLSDDTTWHNTLNEAESYQMPYQLGQLFVIICIFCEPSDPLDLWEKHSFGMIEDFLHSGLSEEISINMALDKINDLLNVHGKSNTDFYLPMPDIELLISSQNINQMTHSIVERYDSRKEMKKSIQSIDQLNDEQFQIFKCIMKKLYPLEDQ